MDPRLLGLILLLPLVAACGDSLCDQSWSAERDALIGSICRDENSGAIGALGDLAIADVTRTMVIIDTSSGRMVRVPSRVTSPEDSRDEAANIDDPAGEPIRGPAPDEGLHVGPEGIGFMVVHNDDAPDEAIVIANAVTVGRGAYVRVIGERSLTLLAKSVVVEGIIDASAGCAADPRDSVCGGPGGGAGARLIGRLPATGCAPGQTNTNGAGINDTGGGGGGFGTPGAYGGSSRNTNGSERPGGAGGDNTSCPGEALERLMGGSGGGRGEDEFGGNGGGGGGALRIIASSEIRIGVDGMELDPAPGLWVSGAGGHAGVDDSGGGGGGSGGAIVLEAPKVRLLNTIVAANGGSGGSGGLNDAPGPDGGYLPMNGRYGPFGDFQAVGGGTGEHAGGNGGSVDMPPANGTGDDRAGSILDGTGGGGGAAGRIRINVQESGLEQNNARISPAPTQGSL